MHEDSRTTNFLKTRTEDLPILSSRTQKALTKANIRTLRGLLGALSLLFTIHGVGTKGVEEIQKMFSFLKEQGFLFTGIQPIQAKEKVLKNKIIKSRVREQGSKRRIAKTKSNIKNFTATEITQPLLKMGISFDTEHLDNWFLLKKEEGKLNTSEDVIDAVASFLGISKEILKSESRKKELVKARNMVVFHLKEYTNMSFFEIGNLLGGRDRTTAIHSYLAAKKISENSKAPKVKEKIKEIFMGIKIENKSFPVNTDSISSYKQQKSVFSKSRFPFKKIQRHKEISNRAAQVLEKWREGKSLQEISKAVNVTRERVRQILLGAIQQGTMNESIATGIIMDPDVVFEEEVKRRKTRQVGSVLPLI
jgi:hypothetical protein